MTNLAEDLVPFLADEIPHVVEVHVRELTTAVELGAQLATDLNDRPQHLIIAVTREEYLARIEFVQCAADGPHVNGILVRHSQDDLWGSIESTDKIRGDLVVCCCRVRSIDGCSQITDLQNVALFIYLHDC